MKLRSFGCTPWSEVAALQAALVAEVQAGGEEVVLYGEHPPTVSLGHRSPPLGAREAEATAALAVVRSRRGGATTVHAPGQAIVYPIVRVSRGVVRLAELLAGAAAAVAVQHGIAARFDRARPGLWVGERSERKLGSIGLLLERRVSSHGLALNVCNDLSLFSLVEEICAMPGVQLTSLAAEGATALPPTSEVARQIAERFTASWR